MALHVTGFARRLHKRQGANADSPNDSTTHRRSRPANTDDASDSTTRLRTTATPATPILTPSPVSAPTSATGNPATIASTPGASAASRTRSTTTPAVRPAASSSHPVSGASSSSSGSAASNSSAGLSTSVTIAIAVVAAIALLGGAFLAIRYTKRRKIRAGTGGFAGYVRRKSDDFSDGKEHRSFGNLAVLGSGSGLNEKPLQPAYSHGMMRDEWNHSPSPPLHPLANSTNDPLMYQQRNDQANTRALYVPAVYSPEPATPSTVSNPDSSMGLLAHIHSPTGASSQPHSAAMEHISSSYYGSEGSANTPHMQGHISPPPTQANDEMMRDTIPYKPSAYDSTGIGMALTATFPSNDPQEVAPSQSQGLPGQGPFSDPEEQIEGDMTDRGKLFIVRRTFKPDRDDELFISPGDRIEMLSVFDDGWCKGINLDPKIKPADGRPQQGFFPRDCVEEIKGAVLTRVPTLPPLDLGDNGLSSSNGAANGEGAATHAANGPLSSSQTPAIQVSRPLSRDDEFDASSQGHLIGQFPTPGMSSVISPPHYQPASSAPSAPIPYAYHPHHHHAAASPHAEDIWTEQLHDASSHDMMMMTNMGAGMPHGMMSGGGSGGPPMTASGKVIAGRRTSSLLGNRDAELFLALGQALDDHATRSKVGGPLVK